MRKDLISFSDLTKEEIFALFELSAGLKKNRLSDVLNGKVLAMIFEKPSLRTRFTFETGMYELGGHAIYLAPSDIGLGKREGIPDVARNLSRWAGAIMARVYEHKAVQQLAEYADVPVINGLSDLEHPCQVLADLFTIWEKKGFSQLKLAWVGDGNNVCNSLIIASKILDFSLAISTPRGYEPTINYKTIDDPTKAVEDADIIYTDVWTSMGQETEREERIERFKDFQVNKKLLSYAKKSCLVMHCLPAHRGEEITDEVIDGSQSIVFDQSENRLHTQKALMLKLLLETVHS